jgi:hypothetical protein
MALLQKGNVTTEGRKTYLLQHYDRNEHQGDAVHARGNLRRVQFPLSRRLSSFPSSNSPSSCWISRLASHLLLRPPSPFPPSCPPRRIPSLRVRLSLCARYILQRTQSLDDSKAGWLHCLCDVGAKSEATRSGRGCALQSLPLRPLTSTHFCPSHPISPNG